MGKRSRNPSKLAKSPLRQALQDIEDAEGPEVNAQCHEALRILLNTLNA